MSAAPPTRLDGLLARAAREHPTRPAITDGDRTVDYATLERTVEELAAALARGGVRSGDLVGVYAGRSLAAVTALYAVLRTGAVAAPLDVTDPPERSARTAREAGLAFLLAPRAGEPGTSGIVARLGRAPAMPVGSALSLVPLLTATRGASRDGGYLLFTSGSTGSPKGVLLSHENVLHFVRWAVAEFGVGPTDRIGAQAALTFDLSTFDVFGSAMAGAHMCLMPEMCKAFPRDAARWLREERVTVLYAVPTLYRALIERGGVAADPPPLRIIAFAGEPFPPGVLHRYTEAFGRAAFYNLYGPTETNVCTFERLAPGWSPEDGVSIGRPLPGTRVELVDGGGAVTGEEGEIAVAGPSVFQGYLHGGLPHDHTAPIVFGDGTTVRAYLTGDLARRAPDGRLYLRGRRDHQVKRRGHRIELHEIESVVQEIPAVRSCAAIWRPDLSEDGEIWLFAAVEGTTRERLARAVHSALPRSMAPDRVELLPELPVNQRGKIDREHLASVPASGKVEHGQR